MMMYKRMFWLLTAVCLPLFVLYGGLAAEETAVVDTYSIIINEIHADPDATLGDANGDGVRDSSDDEFVELINADAASIDISGWEIHDGIGNKHIFPANTVLAGNCAAIVLFGGGTPTGSFGGALVQIASSGGLGLNNSGDTISLYASDLSLVADYTYGGEGGDDQSLTRNPDIVSDDPLVKHMDEAGGGLFSPGTQISGNPFDPCQSPPVDEADLVVSKSAPANAQPGDTIVYDINLRNSGTLSAANTLLADTLPADLTYLNDDSGYPLIYSDTQTIVWDIGNISTDTIVTFQLTGTIALTAVTPLNNQIIATTTTSETILGNNAAVATTNINVPSLILIDAVLYDGIESGDPDEAVRLWNGGIQPVDLTDWALSDGGTPKAIPSGLIVAAGDGVWLANDQFAFIRQFGFAPDAVLAAWPGFSNSGDEVLLLDGDGLIVDSLIYESGNTSVGGWIGTAVYPYAIAPASGSTGQILYRKRDQLTGFPVLDSNRAADWAQSTDDVINGRKVRYPGWDFDEFFQTVQVTETAVITIAIAPDNAYDAIIHRIEQAQHNIQSEVQTIENHGIGDALVAAQMRGVTVTMLLEGGVAFQTNKIPDAERYQCQRLEAAGGDCYFMVNDSDNDIADRYGFLHAKFMLIDGHYAIISSENLSPNSLPNDDKSDGTFGRRGVVLITDAPSVITHLQTVFAFDLDLTHVDIVAWQAGTTYGEPPAGYVPITVTGGTTYTVQFTETAVVSGLIPFEIIQSPENSLRNVDSLLGLINRAGDGDTVLVQQLNERPFWGASTSNPIDDPNPRLEAYINAARRGATVRIMLDGYFSPYANPNGNGTTCRYINQLQYQEQLNIQCTLENPAGLGIHNKMVLVEIDGRGYVHVGSLNGSEQSSKGNREIALQFQSDEAFAYLAEMFDHDWVYRIFLPTMMHNYIGPASHILISEILYNPIGLDNKEFIEIVNPTGTTINLSDWSISDAITPLDFADLRHFPIGTQLSPHTTLVIALTASAYFNEYGEYPDFEILETVTAVPTLRDDTNWGDPSTYLQLGNTGDVLFIRDEADQVVDVMVYGDGVYGNLQACPLVVIGGASLERNPYWRDTTVCPTDFREQPFPTPNELP